jgi:protein-tyrosine kinase
MGRLDNAMRRAAEDQAIKGKSATMDAVDPGIASEFPDEQPLADVEQPETAAAKYVSISPSPLDPVDSPRLSVPAEVSEVSVHLPAEKKSSLLSHVDSRLATKTVIDDTMLPAAREQYRKLAAAMHQAQRANGFKVMMVASALAGEGKTLTAANLALTLSESYRRNVLVIDGDLRRPSMHTVFQVAGAPGLSEGLTSREETSLPLHRIGERLTLLPAGRPTSDPISALTAERARRLIDEAREVFDWIIIDTPPIGLLTDASLVSSLADGVILVVKAGSTPYDMVTRAVDALGRERLMGVVLNRATEREHRSNYDYYKYYGPTTLPAVRG